MTTLHETVEAIRAQSVTWREHLRQTEIAYWTALLAKHGNSVAAAASEAGMTRTHSYEILKRLGIRTQVREAHRGNWGEA